MGVDPMSSNIAKKQIRVTLTRPYLEAMDSLIEHGIYVDRGETIKDALRRLFRHYEIEPFAEKAEI